MEHIYPAFERGRIMRKELLWALRDYSYSALQLQYQDYPAGIISGCHISVEDNMLIVGKGIVKCQDFIFLLTEEERIPYTPTEVYVSLKFRVKSKDELPDYTRYATEFVLDKNLERAENELEMCRFKLKEGARLRTEYKDFYDIQTEFDTVNLADAAWAARGGNTLSKEITDYIAHKKQSGNHYKEYRDYWENRNYTFSRNENPELIYVRARDIEGVYLSNRELENPEGFWTRNGLEGWSRENILRRASHVQDVRQNIEFGVSLDEMSQNTILDNTIRSYYNNPVQVAQVGSFFAFQGDGRHRILVAQSLDTFIPVLVIGSYT